MTVHPSRIPAVAVCHVCKTQQRVRITPAGLLRLRRHNRGKLSCTGTGTEVTP